LKAEGERRAAASLGTIRAVLCDLDGTLIDTLPGLAAALNLMRDEFNLPALGDEEVGRYVGKGSDSLVERTLALNLGDDEISSTFDRALKRYLEIYAVVSGQKSELYPGVAEGLAEFARLGCTMACVTNKPRQLAVELLAHFGLERYIGVVVGGDSGADKKPHPGPLLAAGAGLGVTMECTVMLGDSDNDAIAARAAGCRVLLVPYGYHYGYEVRELDTDGIVDSLLAAARWIEATNHGQLQNA
jgi:phosphoglycolate phosphatase